LIFVANGKPTDRQGMRLHLRVYCRGVRLKGETIVAEGNALGTRQNLLALKGQAKTLPTREDSSGIDSDAR
jgi:hypothetical protein